MRADVEVSTVSSNRPVEFCFETPRCGHPSFMDTPHMWTLFPHIYDGNRHLIVWFAYRPIVYDLWPMAAPSFTSVDTSLLWTLLVRPAGVHIAEVLLYLNWCTPFGCVR